jgi:hypothetical protein
MYVIELTSAAAPAGVDNAPEGLWNTVFFASRAPDARKDAVFSVQDLEAMLWAAHAGTAGSDPTSVTNRYTDNHDGLVFEPSGLEALRAHFVARDTYPIDNETRLAYLCMQSYIIDPTGWSAMPVTGASWPGCDEDGMTALQG